MLTMRDLVKDVKGRLLLFCVALFACYGVYGAASQGFTFYRDYQEFKAMRVWVRLKVTQEQKARELQQKQAQQPPALSPQSAPPSVPQ